MTNPTPPTLKPKEPAAPQAPAVEVTRRQQTAELLELDPKTVDPNLHYRWVKREGLRVTNAKLKGYQPVHKDSGVKTLAGTTDSPADGTIVIGDVMLMATPKHLHEEGRASIQQTNEQRLKRAAKAEDFKAVAAKNKVEVITDKE